MVEAFSQSFSPFLLFDRLGERKPSAESGLKHTPTRATHTRTHTPCRKHIHTQSTLRSRFFMPTRFFTLRAYERCENIFHGCIPCLPILCTSMYSNHNEVWAISLIPDLKKMWDYLVTKAFFFHFFFAKFACLAVGRAS